MCRYHCSLRHSQVVPAAPTVPLICSFAFLHNLFTRTTPSSVFITYNLLKSPCSHDFIHSFLFLHIWQSFSYTYPISTHNLYALQKNLTSNSLCLHALSKILDTLKLKFISVLPLYSFFSSPLHWTTLSLSLLARDLPANYPIVMRCGLRLVHIILHRTSQL